MKSTSRALALLFLLVLLSATAATAVLISEARQALDRTIGGAKPSPALRAQLIAVLPDTDDSFFQGLIEGIRSEAAASRLGVQVFRYAADNAADAARYVDIAQRIRVDGLILFCPVSADLPRLRKDAAQAGVVFVPVGTNPPLLGSQGFIGADSLLQGRRAGSLIGQRLGSAARVGIILPESGPGAVEEEAFHRGVAEALRAFPGSRIEAAARVRRGILSGEEASTKLLRSGAVNAIVCSSAQDTEGAAQVAVDRNLVGQVLIVGMDETPAIRRFIDKGVVLASIVRDSRRIGVEAVRAYGRQAAGQVPADAVETGFTVLSAEGVSR